MTIFWLLVFLSMATMITLSYPQLCSRSLLLAPKVSGENQRWVSDISCDCLTFKIRLLTLFSVFS